MITEQYKKEYRVLGGVEVEVLTYKIGEEYFCHVANKDPGATIARAGGATREEAVTEAMSKALQRLG